MSPDATDQPIEVESHTPETWDVAHRIVQQLFAARLPVTTLDDDCGTARAAIQRLVTSSMQVFTYLDNLTEDLPEGADAVRAFRGSHTAWFCRELEKNFELCAELGYDLTQPSDG